MWKILEHRQADKELSPGRVPVEILKRHEKWKDIATISGPGGLRTIRGFHDEALAGDRKDCRSSRPNEPWRVIYSVKTGMMTVLVIRVTPHGHRRR